MIQQPLFFHLEKLIQCPARSEGVFNVSGIVEEDRVEAVGFQKPQAVLHTPADRLCGKVVAFLRVGADLCLKVDLFPEASGERQAHAPLRLSVEGRHVNKVQADLDSVPYALNRLVVREILCPKVGASQTERFGTHAGETHGACFKIRHSRCNKSLNG